MGILHSDVFAMTYHYKALSWDYERFEKEFGNYLYMKYCELEGRELKDFQGFMDRKYAAFRKLIFGNNTDWETEWAKEWHF